MEESRMKDTVKNSSQAIMQTIKDAVGSDLVNVERFVRFTLNETRDERAIISSKKWVYDIAVVVLEALDKMIQEEKELAAEDTLVTDK